MAACLLHMWGLSLLQRCCWRSGFHGTSLCVEWWLLSRRFETSINSTSQHGVTSQKTCISVSKICPKVISNFVRILRCSYSSRVFAYLTRVMTSWTVHCVWNQENVGGMVTLLPTRQLRNHGSIPGRARRFFAYSMDKRCSFPGGKSSGAWSWPLA